MTYKSFDLETNDGVAHLTLNRPDAFNTMIREFWSELPTAVRQLDEQGDARALVISSTGKHFTSGIDLSIFSQDELIVLRIPDSVQFRLPGIVDGFTDGLVSHNERFSLASPV